MNPRNASSRMILVVAVIAAVGTAALYASLRTSSVNSETPQGDLLRQLPDPGQAGGKPAATVNGAPISAFRLRGVVAASAGAVTPDLALEQLIDYELLFQEGKRRGLMPSDSELTAAIAETRANTPASATELAIEYARRAGTELTPDSYWTHPDLREATAKAMTSGRAREALGGADPRRSAAEFAGAMVALRAKATIVRNADVIASAR